MRNLLFPFVLFFVVMLDGCTKNDVTPVCLLTSNGVENLTYTNNRWTGGSDERGTYTIVYDDNNRRIEFTYSSGYTDKFTYDAGGKVISTTTSIHGTVTQVVKTIYNSNGQVAAQHYQFFNMPPTDSTVNTFSYANATTHNISTMNQTYYNSGSLPHVVSFNATYEYDSKRNPLSVFDNMNPQLATDNNVTKVTYSASLFTTTTYTYNDKGYPVTAVSISTNGNTDPTKFTYNYTYSNCQ
jgi:YD repeat-containing protein